MWIQGGSLVKYMGVTFSMNCKGGEDMSNKIDQGKSPIRQSNSAVRVNKITNKTNHFYIAYRSKGECITTYRSEVWELKKWDRDRLLALGVDFWRSCDIFRWNMYEIKDKRVDVGRQTDTIEATRLR